MKTNLFFLFLAFFCCQAAMAHNGKIYFAPMSQSEINIDGKLDDWPDNVKSEPIELFGKNKPKRKDLKASFRVTHTAKQLYVAVEIIDDIFISSKKETENWYEEDLYILYINLQHTLLTPSVVRFYFTERGVEVEKHTSDYDSIHQFIAASNVEFKLLSAGNKRTYEIKITLPSELIGARTIGLDHQIIDVDKDDKHIVAHWGRGFGSWLSSKFFSPGFLGDVFLLAQEEEISKMNTYKGRVSYDRPLNNKSISKIKVAKANNPQQWTLVKTDTLGKFSVTLPTDEYIFSAGDIITNSNAMDGFDNQFRIDMKRGKQLVSRKQSQDSILLNFLTYSEPDFLIPEEGILKTFVPQDEATVDNFIETYSKYYNTSAISLALIKDNEIVYHKKYGKRSTINNTPLEKNAMFQAASITKSVFAFIVMRLVEKGLVDLDTPIYEKMPFKNIAHNDGYKIITPRLILSHQTGLDNWPFGGPTGWQGDGKADFSYYPGTDFSYSGEAYQWLSRYVQEITGKNLHQLLEEEIKTPLNIQNIHFCGNDSIYQANGTFESYPTLWGMTPQPGVAHSIMTEAGDFAKFVVELGKQTQLKPTTFSEMFTPIRDANGYPLAADSPYSNRKMGLGFYILDTENNGRVIVHGGNNGDWQCIYKYFIDKKMGFVIFTNSHTGHKIWQALEKLLVFGNK